MNILTEKLVIDIVSSLSMEQREAIIGLLLTYNITEEERVELFSAGRDIYCSECGYKQPENQQCQCANDE